MIEELISIIVPVYNDEVHIEKCIRSIMNQTYHKLEIIIVDDGSIDNTATICRQILKEDNRIHYFAINHGGVCVAREYAIKKAKGEFIGFVDSDDWIESDYFQILYEEIGRGDLVGCSYIRDEADMTSIVHEKCKRKEYDSRNIEELHKEIMYPGKTITPMLWNKLIKAHILKEECQKVNPKLRMASDAVLTYLCLLKCNSVKIIDMSGYHYCLNKKSITESADDYFLENVNDFYINLKINLESHYLGETLIDNLKRCVVTMLRHRLNYKLDIPKDYRIPSYYYPYFGRLEGMKVILYGAGKVGKEYYDRMVKDGECQIVMWVDKQFDKHQKEGLPVKSPDEISSVYYDVVIIAVEDIHIYKSIKKTLMNNNVDVEKIIWNKTKAI